MLWCCQSGYQNPENASKSGDFVMENVDGVAVDVENGEENAVDGDGSDGSTDFGFDGIGMRCRNFDLRLNVNMTKEMDDLLRFYAKQSRMSRGALLRDSFEKRLTTLRREYGTPQKPK